MGDEHLFWEGAGMTEREWNYAWNEYINSKLKNNFMEQVMNITTDWPGNEYHCEACPKISKLTDYVNNILDKVNKNYQNEFNAVPPGELIEKRRVANWFRVLPKLKFRSGNLLFDLLYPHFYHCFP